MLIGVTGGIGAGKSDVARHLAPLLGAALFSADDICRELLEPDRPGYLEFVARWGDRFIDDRNVINRTKLRRAAFADISIRASLESILHPLVRGRLVKENRIAGRDGVVVAEVPLLYECGWQDDFDWIVCVYVPADLAAARVARRDGVSFEEARAVIAVQLPPEEKKKRADSVIDNGGSPDETDTQVNDLALFLRRRFSLDQRSK